MGRKYFLTIHLTEDQYLEYKRNKETAKDKTKPKKTTDAEKTNIPKFFKMGYGTEQ